jgi:hypothetical protein
MSIALCNFHPADCVHEAEGCYNDRNKQSTSVVAFMKMYRLLMAMLTCLALGWWPSPTLAQAAAWQAIYYTQSPNNQFTLYRVTADGATELPLPDGLDTLGGSVVLRDLSPDGTTLFGVADGRLFLADLAAQTCCTFIENFDGEDLAGRGWGEDAGFNADGTQLAIAAEFASAVGGPDQTPLLAVVDVASATGRLWQVSYNPDEVRLRVGGWDGASVLVMPVESCTEFCGAGPYTAVTFSTYEGGGSFDRAESQRQLVRFGQQLFTTLEIVESRVTETWQDVPLTIGTDGPFTPPNTLIYQQTVIHYDPSNPYVSLSLLWVADGRAVVTGNVLVWRDGQRQRLDVAQLAQLGTPDGWLRQNIISDGDVQLEHTIATPETLQTRELGRFALPLRLLIAPALGTSLGTPPPPFAALADLTATLACAGNLPPRLILAQQGIVLPGQANNLRALPSANAERVGQLAAGAQFTVTGGPVCADGFMWWRVAQDDTELGWTAEGDASEYWLEPLG